MREAKYRQLIALFVGLLPAFPLAAQTPAATDARPQLQALALVEAALSSTDANAGEWKKLAAAYDTLAAENAKNAAVFAARGHFGWERGEHARAVADWQTALRLEPTRADALIGLGGAAIAAGETVQAAALHRQAVAAQPLDSAAHFALANVLFLFRHELRDATHPDEASVLQEALARFADATRLAPRSAEYARAFAETFYVVPDPDWERARDAWEKVRDLSPTKDFALVNLARVQLKMRHFDASRLCLDQVQNPAFQRIKSRLEAQLPPRPVIPTTPAPVLPSGGPADLGENSSHPVIDDPRLAP